MRSWTTRPGERIRLPQGVKKTEEKPGGVEIYYHKTLDLWYKITPDGRGGYVVEEFTDAEVGECCG